jgi:hypothetical protein
VARLFDAYIIVDWSAAEARKTGEQSVWIGVAKRDARFRPAFESHNPATRAEGEALIRKLVSEAMRRGERTLIGFDFALGYPAGTAARLKLDGTPWSAMWRFIGSEVKDKADNTNNRFAVANKMNRLMTDGPRPFWGAPAKQVQTWLSATKPDGVYDGTAEFRATEEAAIRGKQRPKSVWQMHGAGVVGGQALLGIALLSRLVADWGSAVAVWPFGTGWQALTPELVEPLSVVVTEVWPSLLPQKPEPGEVKDETQVRTLAQHLLRLDEKGELGQLFAPPAKASAKLKSQVEGEEGWILGV